MLSAVQLLFRGFSPVGKRFHYFFPYVIVGQSGVGAVVKLFNGRGKILQEFPCSLGPSFYLAAKSGCKMLISETIL
jgi:hypothetical protein